MKNYRVLINGQNFLLAVNGQMQKTGFYTIRFVAANNLDNAIESAIGLLRRDPKLQQMLRNKESDPPRMYIKELEEVQELEDQQGFICYPDEASGEA